MKLALNYKSADQLNKDQIVTMTKDKLLQLKNETKRELINNILPFWISRMVDMENGGFYGRIDGLNNTIDQADKGGILNARILWTFSSAFLILKDPEYLNIAHRAKEYIFDHFFDKQNGGTYWSLTYTGLPKETKKQIYAQAFFIYAFCEYYQATGDKACLKKAIELYDLIEKNSFDKTLNGYFEAYDREWNLLEDLRLSEKDANEKKTMNSHLHILEAYTNLYRVWKNEQLAVQLKNLISLFIEKIVDAKSSHLNLFFDENWNCKSTITSYGHDIEASWLLEEAARVLGDSHLLAHVQQVCMNIVKAASEGLQEDGSLIYEKNNANDHYDKDRHWWPQAEAVVGFVNAWQLTNDDAYLYRAIKSWEYIKSHLIDMNGGEWHWSVDAEGIINRNDDKAGFWKCPYHNGRMCLEMIKR